MENVSEERVFQRLYVDSSFIFHSQATAIIYRTSQPYHDADLEDGNCSVCRNQDSNRRTPEKRSAGQWARVLTVTQFLVIVTVSSPKQPRDGTDGRSVAAITEPVFDEP